MRKLSKRTIDRTGNKFGTFVVLNQNLDGDRSQSRWNCRCIYCKEIQVIPTSNITKGWKSVCKCQNPYSDIIPSYAFIGIKKAALVKRDFDLSYEFLCELFKKQNGICPLTGLEIFFAKTSSGHTTGRETTASLDRIDSSKGYTEDNVQFVDKRTNMLKGNFSEEEFFEICHDITNTKIGKKKK